MAKPVVLSLLREFSWNLFGVPTTYKKKVTTNGNHKYCAQAHELFKYQPMNVCNFGYVYVLIMVLMRLNLSA